VIDLLWYYTFRYGKHMGGDALSVAYCNLVGVLIDAVKEIPARGAELEGK
jgi:hypothetical protein